MTETGLPVSIALTGYESRERHRYDGTLSFTRSDYSQATVEFSIFWEDLVSDGEVVAMSGDREFVRIKSGEPTEELSPLRQAIARLLMDLIVYGKAGGAMHFGRPSRQTLPVDESALEELAALAR